MTIITGYLPTPEGSVAVRRAGEEGVLRRQPVVVVDISPYREAPGPESIAADTEEVRRQLADAGLDLHIEPRSALDPGDALIQAAQLHGAEMIVIGLRHRSVVGKLLMGSYAQKVLLQADCAVLAVKVADDDSTG